MVLFGDFYWVAQNGLDGDIFLEVPFFFAYIINYHKGSFKYMYNKMFLSFVCCLIKEAFLMSHVTRKYNMEKNLSFHLRK